MASTVDRNVAIFWDYESCSPDSKTSVIELISKIRTLGHQHGSIVQLRAYATSNDHSITMKLGDCGVTLVECQSEWSRARDASIINTLIVDIFSFLLGHSTQNATIILFCQDDWRLAHAISSLRLVRRFDEIIVVTRQPADKDHVLTDTSIKVLATASFDWEKDFLGRTKEEARFTGQSSMTTANSSYYVPAKTLPAGKNLSRRAGPDLVRAPASVPYHNANVGQPLPTVPFVEGHLFSRSSHLPQTINMNDPRVWQHAPPASRALGADPRISKVKPITRYQNVHAQPTVFPARSHAPPAGSYHYDTPVVRSELPRGEEAPAVLPSRDTVSSTEQVETIAGSEKEQSVLPTEQGSNGNFASESATDEEPRARSTHWTASMSSPEPMSVSFYTIPPQRPRSVSDSGDDSRVPEVGIQRSNTTIPTMTPTQTPSPRGSSSLEASPSSSVPAEHFPSESTHGPSTSNIPGDFFDVLIAEILRSRTRRPKRSEIATAVLHHHSHSRMRFKEYSQLALDENVVVLGGQLGTSWIELSDAYIRGLVGKYTPIEHIIDAYALGGDDGRLASDSSPSRSPTPPPPPPSSPGIPPHFSHLLHIMKNTPAHHAPGPLRSNVGLALANAPNIKSILAAAGAQSSGQYIKAAERAGLVQCGGSNGKEWVRLIHS